MTEPTRTSHGPGSPDDLREAGLMIAVHNDYEVEESPHTFWLMTNAEGRSFKGEGFTDEDALQQIRSQLSLPVPQPGIQDRLASPDDLRAAGLVVAIHNDFRVQGKLGTFWRMVLPNGVSFAASGDTDTEALNGLRSQLTEHQKRAEPGQKPLDMVLYCPACGLQHIDAPHGDWHNPAHRSHLCQKEAGGCGTIWRPADVPTNGVRSLQTEGGADTWEPSFRTKARPVNVPLPMSKEREDEMESFHFASTNGGPEGLNGYWFRKGVRAGENDMLDKVKARLTN